MERGNLLRWLAFGTAIFLFLKFGLPTLTGQTAGPSDFQPIGYQDNSRPKEQQAEATCTLGGARFKAELSSKGAILKHAWMLGDKYLQSAPKDKPQAKRGPIDLVTTKVQARMPLRTNLRAPSGTDQIDFDDVDWTLKSQNKTSCTFVYSDEKVELTKVFSTTKRPFELTLALTVKNKDSKEHSHRLTIEQTDWRTVEETKGSWGRLSELLTEVVARSGDDTVRHLPDDFEPDDFKDEGFTTEKWRRAKGNASWVAASNSYFSKAIVPLKGPTKPSAEMLIEQWWNAKRYPKRDNDPNYGHVYRARLNYGLQKLAAGASIQYKSLAYLGPKERDILAKLGGNPDGYEATELLDLGVFGAIGKVLIRYLYFLFGLVGTWGWAICLLTITVKLVMFPLSITQIKSTLAMRKLKPQMDELNEKYKEDAQQRGLALQELFRKNKVANPMMGCLPVLLQMPVWFALYQALQTAVELYHTPFGPLIPDLSAPDKYKVIPFVLGASSFLQQQLMPMQGDATQQKMMKWIMPIMFTGMMFFLPAGLGIYFLTNTWLGILQQLFVERYYKRGNDDDNGASSASSEGPEAATA
jgi:YidC/Oxa1 family membrane protein insertase